ncbi:MAG: hypothetical protein LBP59_12560 [Planctomycetaceae bacterium]|jgi:hypothetical protein|nr:hypothetical protein [Planctomycetaceae bacterium]
MKKVLYIIIVLFAIFAVSCNSNQVPVSPVSGEVIYNGKPVENALISFVPQSSNGRGASAQTESNGSFVILTQGATKNGAMTGKYKVLVSKLVEIDGNGNEVKRKFIEKIDHANPNSQQEQMYPQKNLLPEKYAKEETTELIVNVEKKNNHFKLELKD